MCPAGRRVERYFAFLVPGAKGRTRSGHILDVPHPLAWIVQRQTGDDRGNCSPIHYRFDVAVLRSGEAPAALICLTIYAGTSD